MPVGNKLKRVSDIGPIYDFGTASADSTKHRHEKVYRRQHEGLPVDTPAVFHISGEIWNVGRHSGPILLFIGASHWTLYMERLTIHHTELRIDSLSSSSFAIQIPCIFG
jgi:hypothetical protein